MGGIGPPPIEGGLKGGGEGFDGGGLARDLRHFFDMKVEMIKTSIKVKYKLKIGSQLDVYITVSTWQHFKSFKRYKKLKKCARSAKKNLVRGGTKVRRGGD